MRHTPCGCAPYGEGAFHIRRARPLGVPTAKRQTVQTNRFVRGRKFLHRWGHVPTLQKSSLFASAPQFAHSFENRSTISVPSPTLLFIEISA